MNTKNKLRFGLIGFGLFAVFFVVALLPRDIVVSGDIGPNISASEQVDLRLLVFDSEKNGEIIDTIDYDDVALTSDGRFDLVYTTRIFSLPAQSYLQICLRNAEASGMTAADTGAIAICHEEVEKSASNRSVLGVASDDQYTQVGCTRERVVSQAPGLFMRVLGLQPERYEFFNYCETVYTAEEFVARQQELLAAELLAESGPGVQLLSLSGNKLTISEGNSVSLPEQIPPIIPDQVFQDITLSGNQLTLSQGSTITLPDDTGTDDQQLELIGTILGIESGNTLDLLSFLDNTDEQTLLLAGSDLTISNGNTIDLSSINTDTLASLSCGASEVPLYNAGSGTWVCGSTGGGVDTDDQTISLAGTILSIVDGNSVDLTPFLDNTDTQDLSLASNTLSLTDGGSVDLSPYLDNTDELLSLSCASGEIAKWNGSAWACAVDIDTDTNLDEAAVDAFVSNNGYLTSEVDGSVTNELNTSVAIVGNELRITDAGGTLTADLSSYVDTNTTYTAGNGLQLVGTEFSINSPTCAGTDKLTWNGSAFSCAADVDTNLDEAAVDAFVANNGFLTSEVDGSITNELQDLSLTGNILALTDDATTVDLSGYLDNTDTLASLSCSTNEIAKWNGSAWACAVDVDTDTQLDEAAVDAFVSNNGYLTVEVDGSTTNELNTSLTIVSDELRLLDAGGTLTVDLNPYLDNTDALLALSCSTNEVAKWNGSAWACAVDVDTDTDTNLDEAAVDAFVANNGFLTTEVDGSITNELNTTLEIVSNELRLTDPGGTLTVDLSSYLDDTNTTYTAGNGLDLTGTTFSIDSPTCAGTDKLQWNGTAFVCAADIDTDTNLDEAAVDAFVTNNGFLTSEVDGSVTNELQDLSLAGNTLALTDDATTVDLSAYLDNTDVLAGLSCSTNEVAKWNGSAWACAVDVDTDTNLDEAAVDAFVSNNGYLTVEVDGSTTNELNTSLTIVSDELRLLDAGGTLTADLTPYLDNTDALAALSCSTNEIAKWNGSAWACAVDVDTDTDTQLDETAVDAFVANNGYLTTEVDGSTTNELNATLSIVSNELRLTDPGGTLTVDLSSYLDDTNTTYTAGNGIDLTGTTFSIDSPTCAGTDKLQWTGTAFACSADVDTDTNLDEAAVDAFVANNGFLTSEVDGSITNELQDLSLAGNILALTDDATTVDLSGYLDNTDTLDALSCSSGEVAQWNGSNWVCATVSGVDTDDQTLSIASDILTIVDGNSVSLVPYLDNTDTQDLSLATNTLSLTDGGSVDLTPYLDNTDALLALSCSTNEIAKWNGSAWACAVDIDTDTNLDEAAVDAFVANNGYLTSEVDGSTTNELNTSVTIVGDELRITDAGGTLTADLSSYIDTNTTYTAGNGLTLAGTVFSIDSPTCAGTDKLQWNGTAFACSADIDTDTNLDEAAVDAFVANNGFLTSEVDGSVTNELQDLSLAGNILALTDDATTVDLSGYLDNTDTLAALSCSTNEVAKWNGSAWACAVDVDTDTNLDEAAVDAFVSNNGFLTVEVDGSTTNELNTSLTIVSDELRLLDAGGTLTVDLNPYLDNTDALLALSCSTNEIAKWNGSAWACAVDVDTDTDTNLDEAAVDAFVANNGFLTSEVDGSTTNELNTTLTIVSDELRLTDAGGTLTVDLSSYLDDTNTTYSAGNGLDLTGTTFSIDSPTCAGTDKLQWNGTAFACSADIDTDTNLDEAAVDAFVANNGYLTSEVDGSVTNELQDLSLAGNILALTDDATTVDLSGYLDNTDTLAALSCSTNEVAKWNGSAWACAVDVDTDTNLDEAAVDAFVSNNGYLTVEVDGSTTNELNTSLTIVSDELRLLDAGGTLTADLSPYLDNTDALAALSCSTNEIAKWNGSAWACAVDVDTDTDTQLDETAVDTFVANNGYLTTEVDGSTTNELNATLTIVSNELRLTDPGGTLTVDLSSYLDDTNTTYTAGNGLDLTGTTFSIDSPTCAGTDKLQWNGTAFACSADIDTDTNLDEAAVDAFVANNGYLTSEVDGSVSNELQDLSLAGNILALTDDATTVDLSGYLDNTDTLAALSCSTNEVAKWNGSAWACATDIDTDTNLDEAAVDAFVSNNGYLTVEVDGSTSNELNTSLTIVSDELRLLDAGGTLTADLTPYLDNTDALAALSCSTNEIAKWNGSAWACAVDVDTDTDTQLDETAVDAFVANNGYLTVEVDGSTTNELNTTLEIVSDELRLTDAGGTLTVDLSSYLDDTNTTYTAGNGLALGGTTFSINSPTCAGTDKLQWNGTAFACSADVDTDTNLDEAAVDAFVANNGYLTSEVDGSVSNELQDLSLAGNILALTDDATTVDLSGYLDNTDTLAALSCSTNDVAKWNGSAWVCAADVDTDTTYTSGNGLGLAGTVFSINSPTCAGTDKLQWTGSAFLCTADVDTDTNLDEAAVDGFVSNNGYLTSFTEVDGIIGNEVVNATTNGGLVRAGAGTSGDPFTLGLRTDCADGEVLSYVTATSSWDCTSPTLTSVTIVAGHASGKQSNTTTISNRNSTITRTNTGRYTVAFTTAHPDGANYEVVFGQEEDGTNRDLPKVSVVAGTQTSTGFDVQVTVDDNGTTADIYSDDVWSFQALRNYTVLTDVSF